MLLLHYNLGSLVLADALDDLDTFPDSLRSPLLSRLYACNAVVNTLALALDHDRFSDDDSHLGSILLRDPTPIVTVEVLSRTGKAIFLLYDTGDITLSTTKTMIAVVVTALTVVSQVSETASYILSSFREMCIKKNINIRSNYEYKPM